MTIHRSPTRPVAAPLLAAALLTAPALAGCGGGGGTGPDPDGEGSALQVSIESPSDETAFPESASPTFEGSVSDPAAESSLRWASDRDGRLGVGESVTVDGLTTGPHVVTLTATDGDGTTAADSVQVLVESSGFDVRLRTVTRFENDRLSAIEEAVDRWRPFLAGEMRPVFPSGEPKAECQTGEHGIDDLLIVVEARRIDGPAGVLAQARPCIVRHRDGDRFQNTASGTVTIDAADVDHRQLTDIVAHEIGHALGFGFRAIDLWSSHVEFGEVDRNTFTGSSAVAAFDADAIGGEAYFGGGVPLSDAGGHWREQSFQTELMTDVLNRGLENPISRVTLGALEDMGYQMDVSAAEPYSLPMPQTSLVPASDDATLSHPELSGENLEGDLPGLGEPIVVGTKADAEWVPASPGEVLTGLVRFRVPEVDADVTILADTLKLVRATSETGSGPKDVEVLRLTSSWSQDSVTWDRRPGADSTVLAVFDHDAAEVNLSTSALGGVIRDWTRGRAENHGLALRAPAATSDSSFYGAFHSSQGGGLDAHVHLKIVAEAGGAAQRSPARGPGAGPAGTIPLGDDMASGTVYVVGAEGRIVEGKRIR